MTQASLGIRSIRRTLPLAGLWVLGGCGEPSRAKTDLSAVPASAVSGARSFLQRAPSARGEPADTLRMLRSLGDTSAFGGINRMVVVGEKMLVLDYLMNPHLAVVDLKSGKVTEHFGGDGSGPREFKQPHWAFPGERPSEAWVFDPGNLRLSLVDLDAAPDDRIRRTLPVPAEAQVESPTWMGDKLVGAGASSDFTLLVMNDRAQPERRIRTPPPFPYGEVGHWVAVKILNRSFLANDPSRRRIAVAYQWADRLDFFKADGSFLGTAQGPRSTRPSYRIQDGRFFWNDDTQMAYWTLAASDDHVFALYAGGAPSEPFQHLPSKLHVFSWTGEFVRELEFDRPVFGLALAPDGRTLYAPYSASEGHQLIGAWQLPALW